LLFTVLGLLAVQLGTQATDVSAARVQTALAPFNQSDFFRVAVYNDGTPSTVLGRFDIGLADPASLSTKTIADFIHSHPDVYGNDPADLVETDRYRPDSSQVIVRFAEATDGFQVWKSDVVATVANDGSLTGLRGRVRAAAHLNTTPALSPYDVLSIVGNLQPNTALPTMLALSNEGPFAQWVGQDGTTVQCGVDPDLLSFAWQVRLSTGYEYLIDETSQSVISVNSHREFETGKTCTVRHPDLNRYSSGRAIRADQLCEVTTQTCTTDANCGNSAQVCLSSGFCGWKVCQTANGGSGGTLVNTSAPLCFAAENSGTCHFKLWGGRMNPVTDEAFGNTQETVTTACTTSPVAFTSGPNPTCDGCINGEFMREQNAYWALGEEWNAATSNVWGVLAPPRNGFVNVTVDDSNSDCAGGPTDSHTCFVEPPSGSSTGSIFGSSADSVKQDTFEHEFGHFIVWTYVEFSEQCIAGADESEAINETFADLFGEATIFSDASYNPAYSALAGFANEQGPAAAANTSSNFNSPSYLVQPSTIDCVDDFHFAGRALEQAMWEVLFNRNCDKFHHNADCTAGDLAFDTQTTTGSPGFPIFPNSTSSQVAAFMLSAEANAMLNASQFNTKFNDVELSIAQYVHDNTGIDNYNRFAAVFNQHGLNN
jgi:hypothetical protein